VVRWIAGAGVLLEIDEGLVRGWRCWVADRGCPFGARDLVAGVGPSIGIGAVVECALKARSAAVGADDRIMAADRRSGQVAAGICIGDGPACRKSDGSEATGFEPGVVWRVLISKEV